MFLNAYKEKRVPTYIIYLQSQDIGLLDIGLQDTEHSSYFSHLAGKNQLILYYHFKFDKLKANFNKQKVFLIMCFFLY